MAVAKKQAPKKPVAKKASSAKHAASTSSSSKKISVSKPYTKTEIFQVIAEHTDLSRKDVAAVFATLGNVIEAHVKKGAPGVFTLPGVFKCMRIHKPATKARKGINRFTGEEVMFKAKPARNVIKLRALKKLKDLV